MDSSRDQVGRFDGQEENPPPEEGKSDEDTLMEGEDDDAVLVLHLSPLASPTSSAPNSPREDDADATSTPKGEEGAQTVMPSFLRATTPDRIMDWLAFENEDPLELQAFFATMQTMVTPLEMVDLFVAAHEKRKQDPSVDNEALQARTQRFLHYLAEAATLGCDGLVDDVLMRTVSTFACACCDQAFVVEFRDKLKPLLKLRRQEKPTAESVTTQVMTETSVALSLHQMVQFEGDYLPAYVEYGILPFSSSHLAETLTMMEQDMFHHIGYQEFLAEDQPHITIMTKHCQMITDWVVSEILAADSSLQLTMAKKFLNLAVKLLGMNNLNGAMEVWGGIIFTERIWHPRLPSRYQKAFQHLKHVFDPECNMKNYRTSLANAHAKGQAYLPSLNVHTRELFFVGEGNPEAKNGLVNFDRLSQWGPIILLLLRARQRQYTFPWREEEARFLANAWFLPTRDKEHCSDSQNPRVMTRRWKEAKEAREDGTELPFPDSQVRQECLDAIYGLCDDSDSGPGWKEGFVEKVHHSAFIIAQILFSPASGIQCRPRVWKGEIYPPCFSGWDLVNGMRNVGLVSTPTAARQIGQQLLRNGYIKAVRHSHPKVFIDQFGAWYEFVVDSLAVWTEQEHALQQIDEPQQRNDRAVLSTLMHPITGLCPPVYWYCMEAFYCFSGSELVAHLTDRMKIPPQEALELCGRLYSYKYLALVRPDPEEPPKPFQATTDEFYQFSVGRSQEIIKQADSPFNPEARKEKLRRRDQLTNRTAHLKVSAESKLKEIHLPRRSEATEERSPLRLRIPRPSRPSLRHRSTPKTTSMPDSN